MVDNNVTLFKSDQFYLYSPKSQSQYFSVYFIVKNCGFSEHLRKQYPLIGQYDVGDV